MGKATKTETALIAAAALFIAVCVGVRLYMNGRDAFSRAAAPERPGVSGAQSAGLLDLNTADEEALMSLPGIGPALADRIVKYRLEHGAFETIEEIMDVEGIGEAGFADISSYITVGGTK